MCCFSAFLYYQTISQGSSISHQTKILEKNSKSQERFNYKQLHVPLTYVNSKYSACYHCVHVFHYLSTFFPFLHTQDEIMDPFVLCGDYKPPKFMICDKCNKRGHKAADCKKGEEDYTHTNTVELSTCIWWA